MRREKDVMAEILDRANLEEAFKRVLAGRKRKRSFQGRGMVARKEAVLDDIARRLADGSFRPGGYHEREIVECGKVRKLQVLSLYDRVAVHAVMAVVDRRLKKRFVRTTAASIEGRGTHDLLNYMAADLNADPEGTAYCYKFDIRKFYESVSQERLMECVQKVFKDKTLVALLDGFVRMLPSGVSIGLRSSQGLCNLYLSHYLDHELKDKLGVRHYYRYCDDGVVLGKSKAELWKIRDVVHRQVERAGLEVKPNERVFPVGEGIDFLGYVLRDGEDIRLRKRVKQKFARKTGGAKAVKSRKRRRELTASFYGMAKHARCNNLFYALTGRKMKSFKDLNVSYKPEDGKKRFPGTVVSIRELVNLPIIVKDFETGIKTEQGEDRCIVAIEVNGEARKFFTNSEEMKNILQQIREVPDGFPFETIIKTESFGKGRTKYVFT